MTRSRALSGAVLLAGALCACNSDQPFRTGRQLFQVNIVALATVDCFVDVWDRYLDLNINNQVDVDFDRKLSPKCTNDVDGDGQPDCVTGGGVVAIPRPFGIRISVIRAGTSVREDLTPPSATATTITGGRGNFTDQPPTLGETPARDPEPCIIPGTPTVATCVYGNPHRAPVTNVDAQNCSLPENSQLVPPNIGGQPVPFSIDVGPGDVVIVEARASTSTDPFQFLAVTTLDGVPVTPTGVADSGQGQGSGALLSFSYTVR